MPTVYEVNNHSLRGSLIESSVFKNKLGSTITEYQYENMVEKVIDLAPRFKDMNED